MARHTDIEVIIMKEELFVFTHTSLEAGGTARTTLSATRESTGFIRRQECGDTMGTNLYHWFPWEGLGEAG